MLQKTLCIRQMLQNLSDQDTVIHLILLVLEKIRIHKAYLFLALRVLRFQQLLGKLHIFRLNLNTRNLRPLLCAQDRYNSLGTAHVQDFLSAIQLTQNPIDPLLGLLLERLAHFSLVGRVDPIVVCHKCVSFASL